MPSDETQMVEGSFLFGKQTLRKITETESVCVCPSHSDSSETIKVIIITFGTVTASDMIMHQVLIIFIHSGSTKAQNQRCMLSATIKQAMDIFYETLSLTLQTFIGRVLLVSIFGGNGLL